MKSKLLLFTLLIYLMFQTTKAAEDTTIYLIQLFSGGQAVGSFASDKQPTTPNGLCNFIDKATQQPVTISGTFIIRKSQLAKQNVRIQRMPNTEQQRKALVEMGLDPDKYSFQAP